MVCANASLTFATVVDSMILDTERRRTIS